MSALAMDPLLLTPAECVRRVRELDAAVNEALGLLARETGDRAAEVRGLLADVANPDARPDRSQLSKALRGMRC